MRRITWSLVLFISLGLLGCTAIPKGLSAVSPFNAKRYMGTWYEIARLDHRFERGMNNVTAIYRVLPDGQIEVINRAYINGKFKSITGSARFTDSPQTASLAVTFFPPFAGGYHVIWLDADYQNAVVSGPSRNYLWLLSRHPHPSPEIIAQMKAFAAQNGFAVEKLIIVEHQDRP